MSAYSRNKGFKRIIHAAGFSWDGFQAALTEAAFRQVLVLNGALLLSLFWLRFGVSTKMVLVLASFVSLIVELLNTGLEAAVDHTSLERHPLAKRAKDVGSAAQFLALTMLAIVWAMAIWRDYF